MAEERNYQADRLITRSRRDPDVLSRSMLSSERQQSKRKQRVSILMGMGLTFLAVLFDVSEFALDFIGTWGAGIFVLVGWIKDIFVFFFFPLAFWMLGIPPWKGRAAKKKMVTLGVAWVASLVPWFGAVMPETTVAVATTVYLTWLEDLEDYKKESLKKSYLRARRITSRLDR